MALAIFSVCYANEDVDILKKGIESLSKTMIKYQNEFDRRVQFKELQEAIDAIDEAMLGYMGTAVWRMSSVRKFNARARNSYSNCVKPVFEWCIATNLTFHSIIPFIGSDTLPKHDRDGIFSIAIKAIDMGLNHTENSLILLNDVIKHTSDLRDLFKSIMHDVSYDFGVNGYYGIRKMEKMDMIEKEKTKRTIKTIFLAIGAVIFSPIGVSLGLAAAIQATSGKDTFDLWTQTLKYEDQVKQIDNLFQILQERIRNATGIVENINSALEEDKTNLHALRGKLSSANIVSMDIN